METLKDLKSMYVKLVDNLNCSICQDVLKDARDLSCGHTYCLACLQELVAIKGWTISIPCCLCKKETAIPSGGLSSLKQNYKLNCVLDEQQEIMKRMNSALTTAAASAAAPAGEREQERTVQIWVRDLEGKSQSIMVRLKDTAHSLKKQVERKTGIPPDVQRLVYNSKQLEGATALEDFGVRVQSTIELAIPLKGGQGY